MDALKDFSSIALVLINLYLLSSSRLRTCIKIVAVQGFVAGLMPFLVNNGNLNFEIFMVAACTLIMKCFLLPFLLMYSLKALEIKREVEPFVSYPASVLFGIIVFILSCCIGRHLPTGEVQCIPIPASIAISTIFTGLFLIITRKKAVTQVLGYLVFENGIYFFGMAMLLRNNLIIELGILLDLFVLIFVMGITVFHIKNEFDHIDTDRLSRLSEMSRKLRRKG